MNLKIPRKDSNKYKILQRMLYSRSEWFEAKDFQKATLFEGYEAGSRLSELLKNGILEKENYRPTSIRSYFGRSRSRSRYRIPQPIKGYLRQQIKPKSFFNIFNK